MGTIAAMAPVAIGVAEGAGLTEIITYALTTPEKAVEFTAQPSNLTELMWPMTVERSVLRQNMVSGILDSLAYNVARKNKNLALYEIGKVFEQTGNPKEELPNEINSFAFALTGLVTEKDFQTPAVPDLLLFPDKVKIYFQYFSAFPLKDFFFPLTGCCRQNSKNTGYTDAGTDKDTWTLENNAPYPHLFPHLIAYLNIPGKSCVSSCFSP